MKQLIKTVIRNVKSIKGNSLAEFATTTALMATLAATAAPKLSEMSEGAKAEKSRNEIDKIIKQAGQFYQDVADTEGRGRFPGQTKYNEPVGYHSSYSNADATSSSLATAKTNSASHTTAILKDLGLVSGHDGWRQYDNDPQNTWSSVFGTSNADNGAPSGTTSKVINDTEGQTEFKALFGDEVLGSQFQDGHYVYTVVAGGGTGNDVYPPTIYVADIENATDFNNVLMP